MNRKNIDDSFISAGGVFRETSLKRFELFPSVDREARLSSHHVKLYFHSFSVFA